MTIKKILRKFKRKALKKDLLVMGAGLTITLVGSLLSTWHCPFMPAGVWHGIAYGIHAIGFIPFIHKIEPVWMALMTEW